MTTGVVTFDPTAFKSQFSSFATLADASLQLCFDLATLLLDNSVCSIVQDIEKRAPLLSLLTAHVAHIQFGENGVAPNDVVGRIESADQGSVKVRSEWAFRFNEHAAYYLQSKYGALYWTATAQYRSALYVPAPRPCLGPPDPRVRGGWVPGFPWGQF